MSVISLQDRDNVITNRVTIQSGLSSGVVGSGPSLRIVEVGDLPVPLEEVIDHLRIDDPDEEGDLVETMAKAAAAFMARRTAYVLCRTEYEFTLDNHDFSTIEVDRGPLRGEPVIEIQTARGVWTPVSLDDYWSSVSDRSFRIRKVDGSGSWAQPWQSSGCVRIRFTAGFDSHDESDTGLPLDPGLKMVLFLVTGHYYKNRELIGAGSAKIGLDAVDIKGAESLLGAYRQIW